MDYLILNKAKINSHTSKIHYRIFEDNGDLVCENISGFVSHAVTEEEILKDIEKLMSDIYLSYEHKTPSNLHTALDNVINQKVNFNLQKPKPVKMIPNSEPIPGPEKTGIIRKINNLIKKIFRRK